MFNSFFSFSLLSIGYCCAILILTWFFINKKIKVPLKYVIALSAGILITLVVVEFLPHSFEEGNNVYKSLIFILIGLAVNAFSEFIVLPKIKFINQLLPAGKHDCHQHDSEHTHYHLMPSSVGCSAVGCLILCSFFDGIRLASALSMDVETAFIVSLGILLHLLPESVTVVGIGFSSGFSRKALSRIVVVFCLAFLGGFHSFFLLSHIESLQSWVLPFASGLFIYVCSVHLIPMVIKLKVKKWFFLGAIATFLLWQLGG